METFLNRMEVRVLGCLIEKELATPEYYPLTLNALANACNQKSNRNPIITSEEAPLTPSASGNWLWFPRKGDECRNIVMP
jgi:uncharacterized protein YceH (UPF0502 family)